MNDLEKSKKMLENSEYTCVFCNGDSVLTSQKRGVAPLLELLDKNKSLEGYSAADKVVGKGAAFLYVLLKVKLLYAKIISKSALETLEKYKISVQYEMLTNAIRNRNNTEFCPIETAVYKITEPEIALTAIRNKFRELQNQFSSNKSNLFIF